jgi:hypothetical protein
VPGKAPFQTAAALLLPKALARVCLKESEHCQRAKVQPNGNDRPLQKINQNPIKSSIYLSKMILFIGFEQHFADFLRNSEGRPEITVRFAAIPNTKPYKIFITH